ncbi:hypothetical protein [Brevibacillus porteri]|uniref:hypothetical protein n=1 Tax=Brevibacillus porteri TaxID=2126350 RepID=UPI003D2624D4
MRKHDIASSANSSIPKVVDNPSNVQSKQFSPNSLFTHDHITFLQKTIGNARTGKMLQAKRSPNSGAIIQRMKNESAEVLPGKSIIDRINLYRKDTDIAEKTTTGVKRTLPALAADGKGNPEDLLEFQDRHNEQLNFTNMFSKDMVIFGENYKEGQFKDEKPYKASDAFFSQLEDFQLGNTNKKKRVSNSFDEKKLPDKLPLFFYRQNISNETSKETFKKLGEGTYSPNDPGFIEIVNTPNGKTTNHIINDFNTLNPENQHVISEIKIYQDTGKNNWHMKFKIEKNGLSQLPFYSEENLD